MSKGMQHIESRLTAYDQWIRVHFVGREFAGHHIAEKHGIMSSEFDMALTEYMSETAKLMAQKELIEWLYVILDEAKTIDGNT